MGSFNRPIKLSLHTKRRIKYLYEFSPAYEIEGVVKETNNIVEPTEIH